MEKNVPKYFAPQMEVLELYTEGVLCGSQLEKFEPDVPGGTI